MKFAILILYSQILFLRNNTFTRSKTIPYFNNSTLEMSSFIQQLQPLKQKFKHHYYILFSTQFHIMNVKCENVNHISGLSSLNHDNFFMILLLLILLQLHILQLCTFQIFSYISFKYSSLINHS